MSRVIPIINRRSSSSTGRLMMAPEYPKSESSPKVVVVGAGTRFLSAMSYYTIRLANALDKTVRCRCHPHAPTSAYFPVPWPITRWFRSHQTRMSFYDRGPRGCRLVWGPSLLRDLNALRKFKPEVVIFEWWTGTVLHSYLAIALVAKLLGASIIVEFHEVLDTSEDRIPIVRIWVRALGWPFFRMASGFVNSLRCRSRTVGRAVSASRTAL